MDTNDRQGIEGLFDKYRHSAGTRPGPRPPRRSATIWTHSRIWFSIAPSRPSFWWSWRRDPGCGFRLTAIRP